jgi:hypothetical protein
VEPWRAVDAGNGGMEAQKMELWKGCRPVLADLLHFNKEQNPDRIKVKEGPG